MFEDTDGTAQGHVIIRDRSTGEVLVDKRNAIHFGNMSWAVSQALSGDDLGHILYMVFGSGSATIVDSAGTIDYRAPNVSNLQDPSANLYSPSYFKELGTPGATIEVIDSTTNYSDLKITVLLEAGEPAGQEPIDTATSISDQFVFDELALFTETVSPVSDATDFPAGGRMVTHVIFHPVQKSANREIEIEYTIRVQMGP